MALYMTLYMALFTELFTALLRGPVTVVSSESMISVTA